MGSLRVPGPARIQAIARRFSDRAQAWVAGVLAADSTGRLAQLAETCPGAMLFGFALLSHQRARTWRAGQGLLGDGMAGRPLDDLLDTALQGWAEGAHHMVAEWGRAGFPGRGIWHRVADTSGPARTRILNAQRLLIHHAGAQVDEHSIWFPPPLAFSPEDIPTDPRDNSTWFAVVKVHSTMAVIPKGEGTPRARRLAEFVSRNALLVERTVPGSERRWQHTVLLDYAATTGDYPCRSTPASPYLKMVGAWHRGAA